MKSEVEKIGSYRVRGGQHDKVRTLFRKYHPLHKAPNILPVYPLDVRSKHATVLICCSICSAKCFRYGSDYPFWWLCRFLGGCVIGSTRTNVKGELGDSSVSWGVFL